MPSARPRRTQAAGILGAEYAGVLVREWVGAARQFTAAAHQTCLAIC